MVRAFFGILTLTLLLSACTQRLTCPAFQSAFIYDKEELRKRFSYFQEDSTPKVFTASKNKFLIAEPVSYRKKIRTMQTVPMKAVKTNLPDSLKEGDDAMMDEDGVVPGAELDMAARSVIDSIYIEDVPRDTTEVEEDSVYMISKDKELRLLKYDYPDSLVYDSASGKYIAETPRYIVTDIRFNVEQDNYMWYLRDYLVLPDVRLAQMGGGGGGEESGESTGKKEKKGGFFKNLFKKKKKEEVDSAALAPEQPEEEFDYVDEDEQLQQAAPQGEVKEKKGLFRRKKKDDAEVAPGDEATDEKPARKKKEKKKKKAKKEEPKQSTELPEDDDDGF